jgi:hypothetical protein
VLAQMAALIGFTIVPRLPWTSRHRHGLAAWHSALTLMTVHADTSTLDLHTLLTEGLQVGAVCWRIPAAGEGQARQSQLSLSVRQPWQGQVSTTMQQSAQAAHRTVLPTGGCEPLRIPHASQLAGGDQQVKQRAKSVLVASVEHARIGMHLEGVRHADVLGDWLVTCSSAGALCIWTPCTVLAGLQPGADADVAEGAEPAETGTAKPHARTPEMQQAAGWQFTNVADVQQMCLGVVPGRSLDEQCMRVVLCLPGGKALSVVTPLAV